MLQVVCDRCHRVLPVERMESQDYSLTVYVAGNAEPVVAYEDLCDECMEQVIEAVKSPVKPVKPKKDVPVKKASPKRSQEVSEPKKPIIEPGQAQITMSDEKLALADDEPDGHVVSRKPVRHGSK